jgi:hypothetical protein
LLFGITSLGMTVVITDVPARPQESATPEFASIQLPASNAPLARASYVWHPERSKSGMVSVVVSAADQRAIVLRDGVEIGSAPVRVNMPVPRAMAYVVRAWDDAGPHWIKLQFSGSGSSMDVSQTEKEKFEMPAAFRQLVLHTLSLGSVIIVTQEHLKAGSPGKEQVIIDDEPA